MNISKPSPSDGRTRTIVEARRGDLCSAIVVASRSSIGWLRVIPVGWLTTGLQINYNDYGWALASLWKLVHAPAGVNNDVPQMKVQVLGRTV